MEDPLSSTLSQRDPKTIAAILARFLAVLAIPVFLTACTTTGPVGPDGVFDPYEKTNRRIHERNKAVDRAVLRPLAIGYNEHVPPGLRDSISNFSVNFQTPGMIVNNLLQMNGEDALVNTLRFVLNTTLGLGGLVDVAGMNGVPARETDFGETLHFWQVGEGAYLELPMMGPSTQRDLAGRVADFFTNPLRVIVPAPYKYAGTGSRLVERIGVRGRFMNTFDSVLYDSADSYAQTRNAYLQKRRFELGGDEAGSDPYLDSYGASNPYEDPYSE